MLSAKARDGLALAELQGRRGKQKACPCARRAGQHPKQPCGIPAREVRGGLGSSLQQGHQLGMKEESPRWPRQ